MSGTEGDEQVANVSIRIEDVAKCAGVSAATVSRVLNNRGKCSAETRARILAVIQDLGYLPNLTPRVVAQGKTCTLGLLVPSLNSEFMMSLARSVSVAASEAGYESLVAVRPEGSGRRLLGRFNVDGVIVFANYLAEPDFKLLLAERCPAVLLYQSTPNGLSIPTITVDSMAGAHAVVEHLIKAHGRRRIVLLRGHYGNEDSLLRESGYRKALVESDLPVDPSLMRIGYSERMAHAAVSALLRDNVAFDAVFAWTDEASMGVLSALRARGKRVPEDVSVVGFDDVPGAKYSEPPLTTVRAPTEGVARAAVQQLIGLIESGEESGAASPNVRLPTELVVRRSCGCSPGGASPAAP